MRLLASAVVAVSLALPYPALCAQVLPEVSDLVGRVVSDGPQATRDLAIVHVAVFDAANAVDRRFASFLPVEPQGGAPADAAMLAAACSALKELYATRAAAIDEQCRVVSASLPDGPAVASGRSLGEGIGRAHVAARRNDGYETANAYRPITSPGVYVGTQLPIGFNSMHTKPFVMSGPSQFLPPPPPALSSALWARDFNEVKALGGRGSTQRTPEQTAIAQFWSPSRAFQFMRLVRAVLPRAGTSSVEQARVLALAYIAVFDAEIALFDAKYRYNFWRPVTAIRNGDLDDNPATEREATWTSLLDTPPHPEYPCAHCVTSAAVGVILQSVLGPGETAGLTLITPTAVAGARSWLRVADFVSEVSVSRIYGGIHYRNSTEVGVSMGQAIGNLVVSTALMPLPSGRAPAPR